MFAHTKGFAGLDSTSIYAVTPSQSVVDCYTKVCGGVDSGSGMGEHLILRDFWF